jgi:REP element-mobilizing transposase RayT
MPDYHIPLLPNGIYHLLSRANGNEKLFRKAENYRFFLARIKKYVLPVADIFSYCLLPNHFHLLAQIKSETEVKEHFFLMKPDKSFQQHLASDFIMERFSNFLNSYAKSYNKMYHRKGSLFIDFLRRVEITTDSQLCRTSFYIHNNPVRHGICKNMMEWNWSSFQSILNQRSELIATDKILKYFGDADSFREYHLRPNIEQTYKVFKTL